eukprot:Amastigsp_a677987_27.p4 type:complete len:162 gc:universal Amastigsp_a677987_27:167-652(+)
MRACTSGSARAVSLNEYTNSAAVSESPMTMYSSSSENAIVDVVETGDANVCTGRWLGEKHGKVNSATTPSASTTTSHRPEFETACARIATRRALYAHRAAYSWPTKTEGRCHFSVARRGSIVDTATGPLSLSDQYRSSPSRPSDRSVSAPAEKSTAITLAR